MNKLHPPSLAQRVLRLGLVTNAQLQDCLDEVGKTAQNPEVLLRALERKRYLTTFQSQKLRKGDTAGYFLGGYRLLYHIASGSYGRVWRAEDPHTGAMVAIKVLRRRWLENDHVVDLFEREGRVGMSLRHPNIVRVLDVCQDSVTHDRFIVMEFVEGGNLRDILTIRKKLEVAEALRWIEDAAAGLARAHAQGLLHRDIKPTNILISSQGVAKLVDFGLAGITSPALQDDSITVERTIDYAALEEATGVKPGDARSDIYFLGCILYEMLTGRAPLSRPRDRHARMRKMRFDNVPPVRPYETNASPEVLQLLKAMMALDPQQRFQTPTHLLEAIRRIGRNTVASTPVPVETPSPAAAPSCQSTVFVVESHPRVREMLREKLKELGYRVLLSTDPLRAQQRFQQQPCDAVIVDASTTGPDSIAAFENVLAEAKRQRRSCGGILIVSQEQADDVAKRQERWESDTAVVLVRPLSLQRLSTAICELVPQPQLCGSAEDSTVS